MTPWTACQAPLSRGFPRQEYWSRLPFPSPGDLPDPGIESRYPALAGGFFTIEPSGSLRFSRGTSFSEIPDPSNIRISTCRFWFLKRHLIVKHETVLWQPHAKVAHNWPSWWHPPIGTDLVCFLFGSLISAKGPWVLFSLPPYHHSGITLHKSEGTNLIMCHHDMSLALLETAIFKNC